MRNLERFTLLAVTAVLRAQDPAGASIVNKFDTPQVRVDVVTLSPHRAVPGAESHALNRVLIYLDDGSLSRKETGKKAQKLVFHRGQVRWRPASGPYVVENLGNRPVRILEIALKGKPEGPAPASKLDPALVDARHYKVELENDQVRVLRVHYDPHDKGVEHQHMLNRVVLYLNDQTGAKADDVRMAGAIIHTEQNAGDKPADRIAVELK